MLGQPVELNRVPPQLEGGLIVAPGAEGVVEAHRKLQRRPVAHLMGHADHAVDMRMHRPGLGFGEAGVEEHAFHLLFE